MPRRVPPSVFPGFQCTLVTCIEENGSPRLSLMTTTSKSPSKPAEATTSTRRWHRFRFDVPVRAILQRGARELQLAGRGTGMNEGGIGLDVETPVQLGDQVQVEFTAPYAGIKFRVPGMVRKLTETVAGSSSWPPTKASDRKSPCFDGCCGPRPTAWVSRASFSNEHKTKRASLTRLALRSPGLLRSLAHGDLMRGKQLDIEGEDLGSDLQHRL